MAAQYDIELQRGETFKFFAEFFPEKIRISFVFKPIFPLRNTNFSLKIPKKRSFGGQNIASITDAVSILDKR